MVSETHLEQSRGGTFHGELNLIHHRFNNEETLLSEALQNCMKHQDSLRPYK